MREQRVKTDDPACCKESTRTLMCLMHKFKEFIYHRLEELPMRLEKPRVLTNNVHDIRGYNRLVIFAAFHLRQ